MKRYFNITIALFAVALALAIAPTPRPRASNTTTTTTTTAHTGDECPAPDYYACVEVEPGKWQYMCQCQHNGATHGPGAPVYDCPTN